MTAGFTFVVQRWEKTICQSNPRINFIKFSAFCQRSSVFTQQWVMVLSRCNWMTLQRRMKMTSTFWLSTASTTWGKWSSRSWALYFYETRHFSNFWMLQGRTYGERLQPELQRDESDHRFGNAHPGFFWTSQVRMFDNIELVYNRNAFCQPLSIRVYRLRFIAQHCPPLRVEALRLAVSHLMTTHNTVMLLEVHRKLTSVVRICTSI